MIGLEVRPTDSATPQKLMRAAWPLWGARDIFAIPQDYLWPEYNYFATQSAMHTAYM